MEPCNLEANERKNVCSLARYCIYFRNASKCHITMVRDVCGIAYYIFLSLQAVVYYILYMQWFIIMSWFTEVSYLQRVLVEVYTTINIVVTLQYMQYVHTHCSAHTLGQYILYSTSVYTYIYIHIIHTVHCSAGTVLYIHTQCNTQYTQYTAVLTLGCCEGQKRRSQPSWS